MPKPKKNSPVIRFLKKYRSYLAIIPGVLLGGIIGYVSSCHNSQTEMAKLKENFNLSLEQNRRENIFQLKKEAIFDALQLIDTYYSWQDFPQGVPSRKETTELDLTQKARDCYNHLCMTCTNATLPEAFLNCIFGSSANPEIPLELYNKFRNEARKEFGLESLPLNQDRIFLSVVSTEALSAESPNQAAKFQKAPNHP